MQIGGYHAFSLSQVAERVGIRKPSIVHHFPSKQAIAEAVIRRYADDYANAVLSVLDAPDASARDALEAAIAPYLSFSATGDRICLGGALGGEFAALPDVLKPEVARLYDGSVALLTRILEKGRERDEFRFAGESQDMAGILFASLQGALIQSRATGDGTHMRHTVEYLINELLGRRDSTH